MKFQIGDRVKCIDAAESNGCFNINLLAKGAIYTVVAIFPENVQLKNVKETWLNSRFVKVEEGEKMSIALTAREAHSLAFTMDSIRELEDELASIDISKAGAIILKKQYDSNFQFQLDRQDYVDLLQSKVTKLKAYVRDTFGVEYRAPSKEN